MNRQKQHYRTLQVLLWMWFGTVSSFVSVNVVNIATLQTENRILYENIATLENRLMFLQYKLMEEENYDY